MTDIKKERRRARYESLGALFGRHASPATRIEDFGDLSDADDSGGPKAERITLLWSVGDRMYALSGVLSLPRA